MSKFQVIVETFGNSKLWFDDEATEVVKTALINVGLNVLYVNNLDGMRKELYERKEELKNSDGTETREEWNVVVENEFAKIANLFNIGE